MAGGLEASAAAPGPAAGEGDGPKLTGVRCLAPCAGARRTTVDGQVRLSGSHLGGVTEVRFPGDPVDVAVSPDEASARRVVATVPAGAATGRPRVATPTQDTRSRERLAIVPPSALPEGFKPRRTSVKPGHAYFDGTGSIRVRYGFEAAERTGVRIELLRGKKTIRTWRKPGQLPYGRDARRWDGLEGDGDVADDGRYRFRIGAFDKPSHPAGSLGFHGFKFPVRGAHSYGGSMERFGAPRSGGRVHQGQDVFAPCGTRLEAARGGRVQAKAYDPQLYGNYVVIDPLKTGADHMYVHLASPARVGRGDRVHTGERIGSVGNTGNARDEGCQLHFELWPRGWRRGSPADPLGSLRRWDGWS
jgi:murein DD-endopeptidase MepM/ murein hydrolase activator NlpD